MLGIVFGCVKTLRNIYKHKWDTFSDSKIHFIEKEITRKSNDDLTDRP